MKVVIQGNCDDRGSREYNLALGQKRSDGVKRAMVLLGASERQIETVSFGAEKPVAFGQDEESVPLSDILSATASRGVSNLFASTAVRIRIESGALLVIVPHALRAPVTPDSTDPKATPTS